MPHAWNSRVPRHEPELKRLHIMRQLPHFGAVATACFILAAGCSTEKVSRAAPSPAELALSSAAASQSSHRTFKAYLTGYTYWDNTPPGSAAIARPIIHRRAGGQGTWDNPITIAVGHTIVGSRQTLDFPAGSRFYLPRLQKYAIVEDVCGDGFRPQDGPCHTGHAGHPWLDIWVGGKNMTPGSADACARRVTAVQDVVLNPPSDLPVNSGEIASNGCRVFG